MYVIGIDVGTTGTKAYVLNEAGRVCGQGYKGYSLSPRKGGYVEQNPDDWWDACVVSVRQALAAISDTSSVKAISVSTQGGSTFVADENGKALMPAMTWMDARAIEEAKELKSVFASDFLYRKTGWNLNVAMDAAKYLWLKRNRKGLIKNNNCFVSTIEYINRKLAGTYVTDPTNAAMRQLMNVTTRDWDADILNCLELEKTFLPRISATGTCLGTLRKEAAEALGLNGDVRIFNGAQDQYCAAVGAGAIHDGDLLLSTGTAWVLLGITDRLLFTDSFVAAGCHAVPGMYGAMATLPIAGAALDWFRKGFNITDYREIDTLCRDRRVNTEGLYFYPYFNGITFPLWQLNAKATIVGLSLEHDRFDVARAVMEGVVFQMKLILDDYRHNGFDVSAISVMGGALKSDLWLSLIADITGCKINRVKNADAACIGAAFIAGVQSGLYADYESIITATAPLEPAGIAGNGSDYYRNKFEHYRDNWKVIQTIYES